MKRDFTYIDDIIEGVSRILQLPPVGDNEWDANSPDPASSPAPYRIYNIGNNSAVSLEDFISTIERALDRKAARKDLPLQPGDVPCTYADISDLNAATGFFPSTPLKEGIEKFISWYRGYYGHR